MSALERLRLPLSRRAVQTGLLAALVFQVSVLVAMQVRAAWPLFHGTTVRVATVPVDPRSLFRGNYAILRYDTDDAFENFAGDRSALRHGERVYLHLTPTEQGLHHWSAASLIPPADGLYVRARVVRFGRARRSGAVVSIPHIEAYFAPKAEALRLERRLRLGGVAVINVSASGQAALKGVEALPSSE